MKRFAFLPAALVAATTGLAAQVTPPDAGILLIRRNGATIASEEFQIRSEGATLTVTSTARWRDGNTVVLAVYTPRRVTVRLSGAGGEIAREFPAGGTMVLDDSALVFLALLPRHDPGPIRVAHPRAGTRVAGTLAARGTAGDPPSERYLELEVDGTLVRVWYDATGRFVRAELPGRNLEVIRQPPG